MAKIKRIQYEEYRIKCLADGNAYFYPCVKCGHKDMLCKRHGGICISNKCREERKIKNTQEDLMNNIDDNIDVEQERRKADAIGD